MRAIPHKSRTRFLAHNPTGELVRWISHGFTTANKKGRWKILSMLKPSDNLKKID